jgi:predicted phosphodiesterase
MATKIAHLSDLHYDGRGFDHGQWRAVKRVVENFRPNLLIVSGDLVDHPNEALLNIVKNELTELGKKADAQLFVVPGNHDLFHFGNDIRQGRAAAFDRVFPGLVSPRSSIFDRFKRRWGRNEPADVLPPRRLTREPEEVPVLLALLDSNAADRVIAFAGGSVDENDLVILGGDLTEIERAYLVRIAIIHHHVLPIAHTSGQIIGAEPMMVLQNAGTVLSALARHRFDLVLHGHKHRQQFARIDFEPDTAEGYPIAVAAAGSAAMTARNDPRANSFNLIEVEENGRITVKSLFYGAGAAPDPNGDEGVQVRTYVEPILTVKQRAFVRARERHKIFCVKRYTKFEITENGDLIANHSIHGLRLFGGSDVDRRKVNAFVPQHGRVVVDLKLDDESSDQGYRIERDEHAAWIVLPQSLSRMREATYKIYQAGANCMMMTAWEAKERARAAGRRPEDAEAEWVGVRIGYPIEKITIELKLPDSLRQVQPYLRCERHKGFPDYRIENCDANFAPDTLWHIDDTMSREEEDHLRYIPSQGVWRLVIERPMVGFQYGIRWRIPGIQPDGAMPGQTLEWRKDLLQMGERIASGKLITADREAQKRFESLYQTLDKLLSEGSEKRVTAFFVYDRSKLALVPVLIHQSWSNTPLPSDFTIPLGDGIAGAAFQQRRIIIWADETRETSPFIRPVLYPNESDEEDTRLRAHLAVPVYHPEVQDDARPSPWSVIGVVSFGSSSMASHIPSMLDLEPDPLSGQRIAAARGFAQTHVQAILDAVKGI